jgi:thiol-disulfide isomerase/thioredoxin
MPSIPHDLRPYHVVTENPAMRMTIRSIVAALAVAGAAFAQDPEKLKVGSTAPGPIADHIQLVQGDPVTPFVGDKVHVIEFWATWCGPCRQSIPHINKLYQELSPLGLVVVGVSDEKMDKVKPFVTKMGSSMSYTVAIQKNEDSFMKDKFMQAAEQNGIPCAFVVNRAGKVVFIGHPMDAEFERAVRGSVRNRYDPELFARVDGTITEARRLAKNRDWRQASATYREAIKEDPSTLMDYGLEEWRMLMDQAGDTAAARECVKLLISQVKSDRFALNELTQYLATATDVKKRDLEAAQMAADALKAVARSDDPVALSAMAAVAAAKGDWAAASDMQYDAWMAAPPTSKPALKKTLDTYEERRDKAAAK